MPRTADAFFVPLANANRASFPRNLLFTEEDEGAPTAIAVTARLPAASIPCNEDAVNVDVDVDVVGVGVGVVASDEDAVGVGAVMGVVACECCRVTARSSNELYKENSLAWHGLPATLFISELV